MEIPFRAPRRRPFALVRNVGPGAVPLERHPADAFDLIEVHFNPRELGRRRAELDANPSAIDVLVYEPSSKLRKMGIARMLHDAGVLEDYELVCFADDDVTPLEHACTWSTIFDLAREAGFGITQPALTRSSFWSHEVTRRQPGNLYRVTNFVEVMTPIFTQAALARHAELFDGTVLGWGLDVVWSQREGRCAILDRTPVRHERPIGKGYDVRRALAESDEFLAKMGTRWKGAVTLECVPDPLPQVPDPPGVDPPWPFEGLPRSVSLPGGVEAPLPPTDLPEAALAARIATLSSMNGKTFPLASGGRLTLSHAGGKPTLTLQDKHGRCASTEVADGELQEVFHYAFELVDHLAAKAREEPKRAATSGFFDRDGAELPTIDEYVAAGYNAHEYHRFMTSRAVGWGEAKPAAPASPVSPVSPKAASAPPVDRDAVTKPDGAVVAPDELVDAEQPVDVVTREG